MMERSDEYWLENITAPIFTHYRLPRVGSFDLDLSDNNANKRRMIDTYVRFTLRDIHGEAWDIWTRLSEDGILTVGMA
jgi:hypothetical protein